MDLIDMGQVDFEVSCEIECTACGARKEFGHEDMGTVEEVIIGLINKAGWRNGEEDVLCPNCVKREA